MDYNIRLGKIYLSALDFGFIVPNWSLGSDCNTSFIRLKSNLYSVGWDGKFSLVQFRGKNSKS